MVVPVAMEMGVTPPHTMRSIYTVGQVACRCYLWTSLPRM